MVKRQAEMKRQPSVSVTMMSSVDVGLHSFNISFPPKDEFVCPSDELRSYLSGRLHFRCLASEPRAARSGMQTTNNNNLLQR